jgi:hypothetical protein
MSDDEVKLAILDDEAVAKVRALEKELGDNVVVLAYDRPLELARLNQEQLDRLTDVERALPHAYLVAYLKPKGPG